MALFEKIQPRSREDDRPSYSTINGRRGNLVYWSLRKRGKPWSESVLLGVKEALRFAAKDVGVNQHVIEKPYLGRFEVEQLIDFDTERTKMFPLAEQHHLAWLLGCVCGVRPSSLAELRDRKGCFFNWGDIEITRSTASAFKFTAIITFRWLKGTLVPYFIIIDKVS